jgi:hypothetical protein
MERQRQPILLYVIAARSDQQQLERLGPYIRPVARGFAQQGIPVEVRAAVLGEFDLARALDEGFGWVWLEDMRLVDQLEELIASDRVIAQRMRDRHRWPRFWALPIGPTSDHPGHPLWHLQSINTETGSNRGDPIRSDQGLVDASVNLRNALTEQFRDAGLIAPRRPDRRPTDRHRPRNSRTQKLPSRPSPPAAPSPAQSARRGPEPPRHRGGGAHTLLVIHSTAADQDEAHADKIIAQLGPYQDELPPSEIYTPRSIVAGREWRQELERECAEANVILVIATANLYVSKEYEWIEYLKTIHRTDHVYVTVAAPMLIDDDPFLGSRWRLGPKRPLRLAGPTAYPQVASELIAIIRDLRDQTETPKEP